VYKAKIGDKYYALKKIKMEMCNKHGFPITSIREIKVLKRFCEHPNIVQLGDIVRAKGNAIYLVLEFVDNVLGKCIKEKNDHVIFNKL
jgi:serine/threonine protein kinase